MLAKLTVLKKTHIIIIDNGRSGILGGTFQEMLRCIRCGACMNICPVCRHISGHGYGSVYPGPMGCCIDSIVQRLRRSRRSSIRFHIVRRHVQKNCPVAIPLHRLLMEHTVILWLTSKKNTSWAEEAIFTAAAKMFGNSTFDLAPKLALSVWTWLVTKKAICPTWTQSYSQLWTAGLNLKKWDYIEVQEIPVDPYMLNMKRTRRRRKNNGWS